jgi:hypothetical protein
MQEDQHPINSKGWMDAYPSPTLRSKFPVEEISVEELGSLMEGDAISGKDYLVVDVRRADCVVGILLCPSLEMCV